VKQPPLHVVGGDAPRGTAAVTVAFVGSVVLLAAAVVAAPKVGALLAPLVAVAAIVAAAHRRLLGWDTLVRFLAVIVFLIPIKRYTLPGGAGFNLEPYRVLVALIAAAWTASLLIDPRVRGRRSGLERPILVFVGAILASIAVNDQRIRELGIQTAVVKTLTFFASFFVLFYLLVSLLRTHAQLHALARTAVVSGSVVAVAALVESRLHFNVFNHLHSLLPVLTFHDPALTAGLNAAYLDRAGAQRAYASAAHPIELSAVLVMLIPLGAYLRKVTGRRRWTFCVLLLVLGMLTTLSRTGIVMIVVEGLVFFRLRPVETKRLVPLLIPAFLAVSIALPHTLGSLYAVFFPKGGLVAEQNVHVAGNAVADGRLARIGPSLKEFLQTPLLGQGFGTRISQIGGVQNAVKVTARILDDQWLGSLLEIGLVGTLGLLWMFVRTIRRLNRLGREDDDEVGWLACALAASLTAFCVGIVTFDAFGFIQVTILTFVLLAVSCSLVKLSATPGAASARSGP
jgi:hypothetical protein